jgi:Uma2 family endonuclease
MDKCLPERGHGRLRVMSSMAQGRSLATVADLLAIPPDERYHEIIEGELIRKAAPAFEHGDAQSALASLIKGPFQRRPGGTLPGGWWIGTEVEVEFAPNHVYRPDVVGWRRERVPERPSGTPIQIRPDWVCEVLSPSNPGTDRVKKLNHYHQFEVRHYWIVDPMEESLSVMRWTADGYLLVHAAGRDARVHAEPFEAILLPVGALFGDEME